MNEVRLDSVSSIVLEPFLIKFIELPIGSSINSGLCMWLEDELDDRFTYMIAYWISINVGKFNELYPGTHSLRAFYVDECGSVTERRRNFAIYCLKKLEEENGTKSC